MLEDTKFCKECGKSIPKIKIDTLGRKNTRTSNYCNNNRRCRNNYLRKHNLKKYQDYMKDYYKKHPEKFLKKKKVVTND